MRYLKYLIFISLSIEIFSCGPAKDDAEKKKKAFLDSIRMADSLKRMTANSNEMKKAIEDSILGVQDYQNELNKYDSLKALDSLKLKYKKHRSVKPAPKRELGGRSPVK